MESLPTKLEEGHHPSLNIKIITQIPKFLKASELTGASGLAEAALMQEAMTMTRRKALKFIFLSCNS